MTIDKIAAAARRFALDEARTTLVQAVENVKARRVQDDANAGIYIDEVLEEFDILIGMIKGE